MKASHFSKTHFQEIVHIVDMDGAYIPDIAVVEDAKAKKTQGITSLAQHVTVNKSVHNFQGISDIGVWMLTFF